MTTTERAEVDSMTKTRVCFSIGSWTGIVGFEAFEGTLTTLCLSWEREHGGRGTMVEHESRHLPAELLASLVVKSSVLTGEDAAQPGLVGRTLEAREASGDTGQPVGADNERLVAAVEGSQYRRRRSLRTLWAPGNEGSGAVTANGAHVGSPVISGLFAVSPSRIAVTGLHTWSWYLAS